MEVTRRKGISGVGYIPNAHADPMNEITVLGFRGRDPHFREALPGDGNEIISFETTDPDLLRQRSLTMAELRKVRQQFKTKLRDLIAKWKLQLQEQRKAVRRRMESALMRDGRISYDYAQVELDPIVLQNEGLRMMSRSDLLLAVRNRKDGEHLRHFGLTPNMIQGALFAGKYKINWTFERRIRGKNGRIVREHSTFKKGYSPIWLYNVTDVVRTLCNAGTNPTIADRIVGQYRVDRRVRRFTAKEVARIRRKAKASHFITYLRDFYLQEWLFQNPRPDITNNEELRAIRDKAERLRHELNSLIEPHMCTHTKTRASSKKLTADATVAFGGCDYSDGSMQPLLAPIPFPLYGTDEGSSPATSPMLPLVVADDSPFLGVQLHWRGTDAANHISYVDQVFKTQFNNLSYEFGVDVVTDGNFSTRTQQSHVAPSLDQSQRLYKDSAEVTPDYRDRENNMWADMASDVSKLEGLIFSENSSNRLSRSVAELKDMPDTVGPVRDFLSFLTTKGAAARKMLLNPPKNFTSALFTTVRGLSKAYLWWKFGIEPVVSDVNQLLQEVRSYLRTYRSGIKALYSCMDDIQWDYTFKRRRNVAADEAPGRQPVSQSHWHDLFLPCLPLSDPLDDSSYQFGYRFGCRIDGHRPDYLLDDHGHIIGMKVEKGRLGKWWDKTDYVPSGTPLIQASSSSASPRQLGDKYLNLLFSFIGKRVKHVECTRILYRTLDYKVFNRFSAEEVRAAFGIDEDGLNGLLSAGRALTTSWELMPYSFVADWFFSTRRAVEAFNRNAFLLTEGLKLKPMWQSWYGRHFRYACQYQPTHTSFNRLEVGSEASLLDEKGGTLVPEPFRKGRLLMGLDQLWNTLVRSQMTERMKAELGTGASDIFENTHYHSLSWHTESWDRKYVAFQLPILRLGLDTRTYANESEARLLFGGNVYERYPFPEGAKALQFMVLPNVQLCTGKLASLTALLISLSKVR